MNDTVPRIIFKRVSPATGVFLFDNLTERSKEKYRLAATDILELIAKATHQTVEELNDCIETLSP